MARTLAGMLDWKRASEMRAEVLIAERAQSARSPRLAPEHQGARRRRQGINATLMAMGLTRDEAAVVVAVRKAGVEIGEAQARRAVQTALRRRVRRTREAASGWTAPRDMPAVTGGVVRNLRAMAKAYQEGQEEPGSLEYLAEIRDTYEWLEATALEALHHKYSNAQIGESFGVSPQAIDQRRKRNLKRTWRR